MNENLHKLEEICKGVVMGVVHGERSPHYSKPREA